MTLNLKHRCMLGNIYRVQIQNMNHEAEIHVYVNENLVTDIYLSSDFGNGMISMKTDPRPLNEYGKLSDTDMYICTLYRVRFCRVSL